MGNPCLRSNNMLIVDAMMLPRHDVRAFFCQFCVHEKTHTKNVHKNTERIGSSRNVGKEIFRARRYFFAWRSAEYHPSRYV